MNNKQLFSAIIILIGVCMLIFSITYSFVKYDGHVGTTKDIKIKCYDSYFNEINGLVCDNEVIDEYDYQLIVLTVLSHLVIFLGVLGLAFLGNGVWPFWGMNNDTL